MNSSISREPSPLLSMDRNIFWMSASFIFVMFFMMGVNSSREIVPSPFVSYCANKSLTCCCDGAAG